MNFFDPADLTVDAGTLLGREMQPNVQVGLRPEHLVPTDASDAVVEGVLELVENLGEYALVHLLTSSGVEFIAKTEKPPSVPKGSAIGFAILPELAHFFDKETGLHL